MRTRSEERRERGRRIFGWSLLVAVGLHVAVFVLAPAYGVQPLDGDAGERSEGEGGELMPPVFVEVSFGPPEITNADGATTREPPDRTLDTEYALPLPPECEPRPPAPPLPATASIELTVNRAGRAEVEGVVSSAGTQCRDAVLSAVADALWYRWLPSERFPAPVRVIQPITLLEASR